MDWEKMLRAYIAHVIVCEGTDFLGGWPWTPDGLTTEEIARLTAIGAEIYDQIQEDLRKMRA